jgi:DNA repair protein RadA/Sms
VAGGAGRRARFVCRECGHVELLWAGRCPACGAWNALEPEAEPAVETPSSPAERPRPLGSVDAADAPRLGTGSAELDRVLGGGILPGSLTLLGGDPGIGKSTLALQCALHVARGGGTVLYASGEESARQLRLRADRLGSVPEALWAVGEADLDAVERSAAELGPVLLIVDSIQTARVPGAPGAAGSVVQVREAAGRLLRLAKGRGTAVVVVGHVTKDGLLAGPRVLEHVVDTVLYFEGDRHAQFRVLRAVKNRFGGTDELGLFEMGAAGLRDVADASRLFLADRPHGASGSVVMPALEGTRPLLVEVQALVSGSFSVPPRRAADGIGERRVQLLLAVLEKRAGLRVGACDVFVKVAGGLSVPEPGADLALAVAVASSFLDRPADPALVAVGEVGLAGEVRPVARCDQRLREAEKMGFRRAVVPHGNAPAAGGGLEVSAVRTVGEALAAALRG